MIRYLLRLEKSVRILTPPFRADSSLAGFLLPLTG